MLYNRICIMTPTYKRVLNGKLITLIKSSQDMVSDLKNMCFSFCVNEDDNETLSFLKSNNIIKCEYDYCITQETKRPHLAKYWNQIYEETKFKDEETLVSLIGDDMEFLNRGWDVAVLDMINAVNGIGVVHGDDLLDAHEQGPVYFFTTRKVVKATEHPFMCPDFRADYIDTVWSRFSQKAKILYYLPELLIKHNHALWVASKDDNWKRLRPEQLLLKDKAPFEKTEKYSDELLEALKKSNIYNKRDDQSLAVTMCTCNRIELLKKTLGSYARSKIKPDNLFVYDDMSKEISVIKDMFSQLKIEINHHFEEGKMKAGKDKQIEGIDDLFDKGYDKVFVIDSDSLFWPRWYQVLRLILWQQRDAGLALFSLFNLAHGHEFGKPWKPTMLPTKAIGGFAMLIYRDTWMKFRESEEYSGKQHKGKEWDVRLYTFCSKNNMKMACTTPTYIQHIGYLEGTHASTDGKSLAAIDFLGDPGFKEKPAEQVANVNRIGISFTGGVEEAVCASIWVNWLVEQGYVVECYTIPYLETLVRCICPTGRIRVNMQIQKNRNWIEANTDTMKKELTHCAVVANVQTRSRENMSDFNMWKDVTVFDFVTNRIIESCGISEIPKIDFKNYLKYDKRQFLQNYNCSKGMKIVSSEGIDGVLDKNIGLNGVIETPPKMTFPQLIGFMLVADEYAGGCGDVAWAAVFNPKCKITIYGKNMRYLKSIKKIRSDAEVIKI